MYEVCRTHNSHYALVVKQSPKHIEYIAATPTGPQVHVLPISEFRKEFSKRVDLSPRSAALKFLAASKRAYYFDPVVVQILKEIVMTEQVTDQEVNAMDDAGNPTADQQAHEGAKQEKAKKVRAARPKKDPSEYKPRGRGIGAFIRDRIQAGDNNGTILEAVMQQWPDAKTSAASIAWYRADLKKKAA